MQNQSPFPAQPKDLTDNASSPPSARPQNADNPLYHPPGGAFALLQAALFVVALIVLGQAIGWPGILVKPPAYVLTTIEANRTGMLWGYTSYLLSSLMLIPMAFALGERLKAAGASEFWVSTVTFFGAAGGILKLLGIVRWLIAMPALSAQYAAANSVESKQLIEISYLALNSYGGSIGELLGVQLVTGLWMAGISALMLRQFRARWLGGIGLAAGIAFCITAGRVIAPSLAAVQSVAVPVGILWLFAVGGSMMRRRR